MNWVFFISAPIGGPRVLAYLANVLKRVRRLLKASHLLNMNDAPDLPAGSSDPLGLAFDPRTRRGRLPASADDRPRSSPQTGRSRSRLFSHAARQGSSVF